MTTAWRLHIQIHIHRLQRFIPFRAVEFEFEVEVELETRPKSIQSCHQLFVTPVFKFFVGRRHRRRRQRRRYELFGSPTFQPFECTRKTFLYKLYQFVELHRYLVIAELVQSRSKQGFWILKEQFFNWLPIRSLLSLILCLTTFKSILLRSTETQTNEFLSRSLV